MPRKRSKRIRCEQVDEYELFVLISLLQKVFDELDEIEPFKLGTTQPTVVKVITVNIDGSSGRWCGVGCQGFLVLDVKKPP